MKNTFLPLLFLFLLIPGISTGAELRTLEIDFTFTAPVYQDKELAGYRLYKEEVQVCQTDDPTATTITCDITTEDGTFSFTLTGLYTDDSESPPSPSFSFTIDSTSTTSPDTPTDVTTDPSTDPADTPTDPTIDPPADITTDTPPDTTTEPASATAELRTLEIEFSFVAPDFTDKELAGYILYKEEVQVCDTNDPTATTITCDLLTDNGTFSFTLTGHYSDNSESPPSEPFPFTIDDSTPVATPTLLAVISPTASSGEAPFNVLFEGNASTGNISTYYWNFGGGSTATSSSASHTYLIPGIYTATLEIGDGSGATSLTTTSITVTSPPIPPEPPTAILSSSTAAGNAPLPVTFDGTSSTTDNPPIVSYSWTFGDGSQATGETTSHTYLTAGTYYTKLTVTDSKGLTATADTPVIILGTAAANEKPVAIISTSLTEGDAPMLAAFDGSQSTDPDGSIASYDWNFGDGTKGTGPTIQHTYIDPGDYTVSLEVTDNLGETAKITKVIIINIALSENILNFEVGEITIDHEWVTVDFVGDFIQPIVIAGPPTTNGSDPVLVRIRNIDIKNQKFEIRLQEWDYLQNIHTEETLTYIVMEKGIYTLDSGIKIEAGSFTGASRFQKTSLQQAYDTTPVILTQVMTENDTGAVTGRTQKSGPSSFEYKMQEQETTKNAHTAETIGYIAWEPGAGEIQGLLFKAGLTSESITSNWSTLTFQTTTFPALPAAPPLFIADMQTYEGRDTAALRTQNISNTETQIIIEEETSKDTETDHQAEVVGYLVIGSATD